MIGHGHYYSYPTAFSRWGDEERAAIERVLKSGQLTMGEEVAAFEREFADFHGRAHAIMVNSGSSANLVATAALFNLSRFPLDRADRNVRGRYAVVPALAWSTTYAPLVQHGLRLELADCDDTWNAPPLGFQSLPRLVVICSILGNPCYGDGWKDATTAWGSYVLEDNCESFGAMDARGKLCGTHGFVSTFSLFYSHQISAIEGGVVLTDDEETADLCRMLRAHGWTRGVRRAETFEEEYDFRVMGYNVRPTEMHAAIAREQLKKTASFRNARESNASAFRHMTRNLPIRHPTLNGTPNPFGLHFECRSGAERARLVDALRANGIDCRLPTGGSYRLHKYSRLAPVRKATPNADRIHKRGLFLGNAPFDLSQSIERAVRVMREVFAKAA